MLIAVIKGPTISACKLQIEKAKPYAEAIELRLDHFTSLQEIETLKKLIDVPVIFTLRRKDQGGAFEGTEEKRLSLIEKLAALHPEYIDLEFDVASSFFHKMREKFPEIQLIVSYHDFEKTPRDLFSLLQKMQKPFFAIYKIACTANSASDLLRMLSFIQEASREQRVAGISMGEYGAPSRVLSKVVGNSLHYASVEKEENALYQMTLQELCEIYRFHEITSKTAVYALLGDPVGQSVGHVFHNKIFREKKIDAVYVKCQVQKGHLKEFFSHMNALPFRGFSVTMPLKEEAFLLATKRSPDAEAIKAVNTLVYNKGKLYGDNTDAPGALDAIEAVEGVRGKTLVVLGAGGAARAIAHEAIKRGARVYILNRTREKGEALARELGCSAAAIKDLSSYDILVNATPLGMKGEAHFFPAQNLHPSAVILETVYHPTITPLLAAAQEKGCRCIFGYEMFARQAHLQQKIWNP